MLLLLLKYLRLNRLLREIMAESHQKMLIFVETKKKTDELTRRMQRDGLDTLATSA